jgi:hypothetical protein
MISGIGTAVGLFWLWGKPHIPVAGAIAMFLPLLVMPLVSLFTAPPRRELVATAFADTATAAESVEPSVPKTAANPEVR